MASSKDSEMLRSDFLIHWTGKDIQTDYKALSEKQRQEYIHRLHTTLDRDSGGLWMKKIGIELYDNRPHIRQVREYFWEATCFTEIKLSDTQKHTERYGCLGFGFSREFVMERFGAPVHYVAGTNQDIVSPHLIKMIEVLGFLRKKTVKPFPQASRLATLREESGIENFVNTSGLVQFNQNTGHIRRSPYVVFDELGASSTNLAVFIKRMSGPNHKFEFLDEAEWRIPYVGSDSMTKKENENGRPKIWKTGLADPPYKIPFTRDDLKILILPDEKTRELAFDEEDTIGRNIVKWLFEKPAEVPIITTVKECLQF